MYIMYSINTYTLLTEMLSARTARQRIACLISTLMGDWKSVAGLRYVDFPADFIISY